MFIIQQHKERPLRWWFSQIGNIEFDPWYQRRSDVWSLRDQQFLIDTIINNFDIPKFYIADFTSVNAALDKSGKLYSIIDGKQRFEAIFRFFKGEIVLATYFVYFNNPTLKLAGLSYQDISRHYPEIAKAIDDYIITVMSVITDAEDDNDTRITQLFIRLNKGEELSGAEIRNAMSGPVPTMARALANHPFFLNNIHFSVGRGQDLNAAAKLLLIEYKEKLDNTKKSNLDKFVQEADDGAVAGLRSRITPSMFPEERPEGEYEAAFLRTSQVLDVMAEVFSEEDALLSGASSLTLYYWLVRNQGNSYKQILRSFLANFENERSRNRALAKEGVSNLDQEMLSYDLSNRSPDDISSLDFRYKVLVKRLVQFAETRPPSLLESVPTETTEAEHATIDWTEVRNMKVLRKGLNSPIAFRLLDMTATHPDEWISFKEIYTAAGFTETRRAGSSLGSMTKVIKRDFGVPARTEFWPVEHRWALKNDAQYYYRMSPEVAQAWLKSAA